MQPKHRDCPLRTNSSSAASRPLRQQAWRPESAGHHVGAMLAQLPRSEYPLTVDVADEMGAYGSDDHYEFVLHQLLTGLRSAVASP